MELFNIKNNFMKTKDVKSELVYEYNGSNYQQCARITISIPTYKRINYFLDAFCSAVIQDYDMPYNIIVVDNDDSKSCLHDKINGVKKLIETNKASNVNVKYYLNNKNIGVNNFNRCIELTDTEYLAFLHDDDMLNEKYLKDMITIINEDNVDAIGCALEKVDADGNEFSKSKLRCLLDKIYRDKIRYYGIDFFIDRGIMFPGFLLKKRVAIASGGLNDELGPCADYVWQWNVANRYKCFMLMKTDYKYRIAENDCTNYDTQVEVCKMPCRLLKEYYNLGNVRIPYFIYRIHASCYLKLLINNAKKIWGIDIDYIEIMKEFSLYDPQYIIFNTWMTTKKLYRVIRNII